MVQGNDLQNAKKDVQWVKQAVYLCLTGTRMFLNRKLFHFLDYLKNSLAIWGLFQKKKDDTEK